MGIVSYSNNSDIEEYSFQEMTYYDPIGLAKQRICSLLAANRERVFPYRYFQISALSLFVVSLTLYSFLISQIGEQDNLRRDILVASTVIGSLWSGLTIAYLIVVGKDQLGTKLFSSVRKLFQYKWFIIITNGIFFLSTVALTYFLFCYRQVEFISDGNIRLMEYSSTKRRVVEIGDIDKDEIKSFYMAVGENRLGYLVLSTMETQSIGTIKVEYPWKEQKIIKIKIRPFYEKELP